MLIGNPPWLRYSKMTSAMQTRYKTLAGDRGLLSGALGASGRDLSTLFVVRSVELYLRPGGSFAFVVPHGVLTRRPHAGFRTGHWSSSKTGHLAVAFTQPWDLSKVTTGFPMVSCVVYGGLTEKPHPIPATVTTWTGRLVKTNVSWAIAQPKITIGTGTLGVVSDEAAASPYKKKFRNGAILYPRMLLFVVPAPAGPLGAGAGRVSLTSRRTSTEKRPWSTVESLRGTVEGRFVRPVHLGETVVPYRLLKPLDAVLPVTTSGILTEQQIEDQAALAGWWANVEKAWSEHKSPADTSTLLQRINFHGQLAAQLPAAQHRVVYTASGNTLVAARLDQPDPLIEHKLYWAAVSGIDEARYLTAILNSQILLERIRPLQALGLFGGRDFDKVVFSVPIPTYDLRANDHQALVKLAAEAEAAAQQVVLDPQWRFQRARAAIREHLRQLGVIERTEQAVARVVPPAATA